MKRCLLAAVLCACGSSPPGGSPDADGPADATIDAAVDAGPGTPVTCAVPANTPAEAIAFASPETIFYTYTTTAPDTRWIGRQDGAVSRPTWFDAGVTIIGKMVAIDRTLYYTDTSGRVYAVDLDATTPSKDLIFSPSHADENTRYGLFADTAGNLYALDGYSGQERIFRRAGTTWSEVTTSPFTAGPIGAIVMSPAGDLLVLTEFSDQLWRISLDGGKETARAQLTTVKGASGLDFGLALDETGALYALSAGTRALTRLAPPTFTETNAAMLPGYEQGMAFGRGCWGSHDLYVAAGTSIVAIDVGASGTP
ncbi:MAG TPA: hypothetical protein VL463_17080 [Kofleriaceae bacterium]|jgi:outer membrane protein assembly factor BamB|nr:hypothetical protein [Kofleriaceae bacterium]